MKNRYAVVVAFGLLALASCGGTASTSTESTGTERSPQSTNPNDGTALSVTCAAAAQCTGTNAVLACTVVKSTAATDAAAITMAVDGGMAQTIATIPPQNFTRSWPGDYADHATATVWVPVPNGTHSLTICAAQAGANGRLSKYACSPVNVAIDCLPT